MRKAKQETLVVAARSAEHPGLASALRRQARGGADYFQR